MGKPIKPKNLLVEKLLYHFHCWSCGGEQWHWFPAGTRLPTIIHCRLCGQPNQLPDEGLKSEDELGLYTSDDLIPPEEVEK